MSQAVGLFEEALAKDKSGEGSEALRLLDTLLEYQGDHRLALFYRGCLKVRYRKDLDGGMQDWEDAFEGAPPGSVARVQQLYRLIYDSCMEKMVELTCQDPNCALYHSGLGRALVVVDQADRGERHLRRAFELDPSRGVDGVRLALYWSSRGAQDQALQILLKQVEVTPEHPEVQDALARLHRAGGRSAFALRHWETVLKLQPGHPGARAGLAELYLSQGRPEAAEPHLQALLELAPKSSLHLQMADCSRQQYRFEEALHHLNQATQLEPNNYLAWSELGNLALQLGQSEQGIAALQRACDIEPDHAEVYGLLAKASLQRGDHLGAQAALKRQLQLDPKDGFAAHTLANLMSADNQGAAAVAIYQQALQARPTELSIVMDLARCLSQISRKEEAIAILQEACQANPNREDLRQCLHDLAPHLNTQETQKRGPDIEDLLNLGRAHIQGQRPNEAFEAFRQVLAQKADHPEGLSQVARLYAQRKMLEPAIEFMLRAYLAAPEQTDLLIEQIEMIDQLPNLKIQANLDQLARLLPRDLERYPWLRELHSQRHRPAVDRLLIQLVGAAQKAFPQGHPLARQWLDLQTS